MTTRLAPLALALLAPLALAQHEVTTSYGIDFVTVGDPGNRDTQLSDTVFGAPSEHTPRGGVGDEFRIGRTEITTGQWFEFVEAYLPYYEGPSFGTPGFRSEGILLETFTREPVMLIPEDRPARVAWQYAARFANWLHNDKANEAWAFETGAYDTSTWAEGPNGEPPADPQIFASPDARFRLPSPDEWIKTVYYDPNRYGEGEGGYWPYPYASATETVSTSPGLGGDSDVELGFSADDVYPYLPVGSYPHSDAPWGALDVSGSLPEMLEGVPELDGFTGDAVSQRFSTASDGDTLDNSLAFVSAEHAVTGEGAFAGFRLVAEIPSPGTALLVGWTTMYSINRRRPGAREPRSGSLNGDVRSVLIGVRRAG